MQRKPVRRAEDKAIPWGYSSNPNGDLGGAALPPDPAGTDAQRTTRAVEQLVRITAPGVYEKFTAFNLAAAGNSVYITTEEAPVSMLTVQVFTGTVDIVFGSQGADPSVPTWRIGAIGVPVNIPLTTRPRDLTIFANGGAATGTMLLHSPT